MSIEFPSRNTSGSGGSVESRMAKLDPKPKLLNTPRVIFRYAEAFGEAATTLIEQAKRLPSGVQTHASEAADLAPMAALDAFSTELSLKCLLAMDWGKPPRGHEHDKLFACLKTGTQAAVRYRYNENLRNKQVAKVYAKDHPRKPMGLDACLSLSAKVFETMRYFYEGSSSSMFFWPILRISLRETILATHPQWKEK